MLWRELVRQINFFVWRARKALGISRTSKLEAQDVSVFLAHLERYKDRSEQLVILDVGSRHGLEAIKFLELFPNATVFCFEANPNALSELRQNVGAFPQITVVGKAINSFDGECDFFLPLIRRPQSHLIRMAT